MVEGCVALADPQTGSVARVAAGEAVFFGPDTWHHAFNFGPGPARILEYFAPPPATGTSGAYAQQQPLLPVSRYADDSELGTIIPGQARPAEAPRLAVVRPDDYHWRLDGDRDRVLTGIIASTPQLTAGRCEVRGPRWSGWISHRGDAGGYVLSGGLALWLAGRGRGWDELAPGDGFFIPANEQYQVRSLSAGAATYLVGYAPTNPPATQPHEPDRDGQGEQDAQGERDAAERAAGRAGRAGRPGRSGPGGVMFSGLSLTAIDRRAGDAAIGIDVGGTKVALGLLDAAELSLLESVVIPTGRDRGGKAVLADIRASAAELAERAAARGRRVSGIGLVVPEIVSLAGDIVSGVVIPQWNELPVAGVLSEIAPVRVEADVRAAAFAETVLGAGQGYDYLVFVTVGTGISYTAVYQGRPIAGSRGGALNIGTTVLARLPGELRRTVNRTPRRAARAGAGADRLGQRAGRALRRPRRPRRGRG